MPKTNIFVEELKRALADRRVVSRKMSSIVRQCGRERVTIGFLTKLEQACQRANIHSDRRIRSSSILPKHSLRFSLEPFTPSEVEFGREQQLVQLFLQSVGRVPPLQDLQVKGREYALPSGRSVDLLCERASRSGKGDLVAVEFKKGTAGAGAVEQLANYLKELKATPLAQGRTVRGLLLAKRITSSLEFSTADGTRIDMYEYKFTFSIVATLPGRPASNGETPKGSDSDSSSGSGRQGALS